MIKSQKLIFEFSKSVKINRHKNIPEDKTAKINSRENKLIYSSYHDVHCVKRINTRKFPIFFEDVLRTEKRCINEWADTGCGLDWLLHENTCLMPFPEKYPCSLISIFIVFHDGTAMSDKSGL